jgi:hypothetical protein
MKKAVIYFNYFAFQTSSNIETILFKAIHPKIWHWLKKHSNEALVFWGFREGSPIVVDLKTQQTNFFFSPRKTSSTTQSTKHRTE